VVESTSFWTLIRSSAISQQLATRFNASFDCMILSFRAAQYNGNKYDDIEVAFVPYCENKPCAIPDVRVQQRYSQSDINSFALASTWRITPLVESDIEQPQFLNENVTVA
jgi:hypothetical protein